MKSITKSVSKIKFKFDVENSVNTERAIRQRSFPNEQLTQILEIIRNFLDFNSLLFFSQCITIIF